MDTPDQIERVGLYFDGLSEQYGKRYEAENPFHSYFFRERLRLAIGDSPFEYRSVLDIGAGTGPLYDALVGFPGLDYYACDISAKMLAQSAIPPNRAFIGRATEIAFPREKFDYIFLLGVTTYQTPSELMDTWKFIRNRLAPGGKAIVSFTNGVSIDRVLRGAMRLARPFLRTGIIAQSFTTYAYGLGSVVDLVRENDLRVTRSTYLNQTFSPFNTLLPQPSVTLAEWLAKNAPASFLPFCSADFIVFAEHARDAL